MSSSFTIKEFFINSFDIFRFEQSLDSIVISVSKRIVSVEHEKKIYQVLASLALVLRASTFEAVQKNINYNRDFQSSLKTSAIKSFFQDFFSKLEGSEHNWRLPGNSAPISYDLHLKTNIHYGGLEVEGEVSIKLKVLEKSEKLTLHSRDLRIKELKLFDASGSNEVEVLSFSLYSPTDMLTISLAEDASPGTELTLHVKYTFNINDKPDMTGFYLSSYINEANERR